jgi:RNA recognition motif. (a.k.a. RRM, RBD, or RNP domain)
MQQPSVNAKEAPRNFDDFDYGDEDDDSGSKKITANTGPELPAALANLLDTLKQNSPSVSHNNVPDNTSLSFVTPSRDKPVPTDNVQSTMSTGDPHFTHSPYQNDNGPWNERPQVVAPPQYQNQVVPPPMTIANAYGPPNNYHGSIRTPHPSIKPGPPNPPISLLDHPGKLNIAQTNPEPEIRSFGNSLVFDDPSLPEGSIRGTVSLSICHIRFHTSIHANTSHLLVLTRTLFVGPLPDAMTKQQIRERFAEYGNVSSVVVSV